MSAHLSHFPQEQSEYSICHNYAKCNIMVAAEQKVPKKELIDHFQWKNTIK